MIVEKFVLLVDEVDVPLSIVMHYRSLEENYALVGCNNSLAKSSAAINVMV